MDVPAPRQLRSTSRVHGLTHGLYRYPAAAPPELVSELVSAHSRVDDLVCDPFMGGGTTIVEALACGRRAVGFDVNSLALFATRAKTTPLSAAEWGALDDWLARRPLRTAGRTGPLRDPRASALPSSLRRILASGLRSLPNLATPGSRRLARCSLLRLGQWAVETQFSVDTREYTPSLARLEAKLQAIVDRAHDGMDELVEQARSHGIAKSQLCGRRNLAQLSAWEDAPSEYFKQHQRKVRLIVTSPPYPGVHVLYHRWQVMSRQETAAPYWIASAQDGRGPSYYMMGSRSPKGESNYFTRLSIAYTRIRPLLHSEALVIQLVAFPRPDDQLPQFLQSMTAAGYQLATSRDSLEMEMTRDVPNRRWYARGKSSYGSREVLMIHRPVVARVTRRPRSYAATPTPL